MEQQLQYHIYKTYEVISKIGKGSYGQVYSAIHRKTRQQVAIKRIEDAFQNLTDAQRTYRQLNYLLQLQHPCIVKLRRVIPSKHADHVYAVFDLMDYDLAKTLSMCSLERIQRKYIACQLLHALKYIHASGLVHRDIKPSNVLINANCDVQLCDFGLSRIINSCPSSANHPVLTQYVAARWYRPPEIILGLPNYTLSIDLWSLGCVLAELTLKSPLFKGTGTLNQLEKIFELIGSPSPHYINSIGSNGAQFLLNNFPKVRRVQFSEILLEASDQQIDLIIKLLKLNPDQRISVSQALEHPFFDEVAEMKQKLSIPPTQIVEQAERKSLESYKSLIEEMGRATERSSATYRTANDPLLIDAIKQTGKEDYTSYLNEPSSQTLECREISTRDSNLVRQQRRMKSVSRISEKSRKSNTSKNKKNSGNHFGNGKGKIPFNHTSKTVLNANRTKFVGEGSRLSSARIKKEKLSNMSKASITKNSTVHLQQAKYSKEKLSKKTLKKKAPRISKQNMPCTVKSSESLLKKTYLPHGRRL